MKRQETKTFQVKPLPGKNYKFKQSSYDNVMEVPFRGMLVGPSGAGKGVVLTSLILDAYRNCFDAGIHIWSHSIFLDSAWIPVRKYMAEKGFDPKEYCHEKFRESDLAQVLDEQKRIIEYFKQKGNTNLPSMLLVFDDVLDDARLMRGSRQLPVLYQRGRHMGCSSLVSVQKFRVVNPIVRINSTDDIIFKLRNFADYQAWREETSALAPIETIDELYRTATSVPHGFLWLDKRATEANEIFHIGFNAPEPITFVEENDDTFVEE